MCFSDCIRVQKKAMLSAAKAKKMKRNVPLLTKKPPSPKNIEFSIKTLDQIRAERKRKLLVTDDSNEASLTTESEEVLPDMCESEKDPASVEQSQSAGEEVLKPAPPKRRLVIKRGSLRTNAKSADSNADSAKISIAAGGQIGEESAASSENEVELDSGQPSLKYPNLVESNNTDMDPPIATVDAQDEPADGLTKEETNEARKEPSARGLNTLTSTPTVEVKNRRFKSVKVLKIRRKKLPNLARQVFKDVGDAASKLEREDHLLLSPVVEERVLDGAGERKKSIAEMKAEM